MIPSEQCKKQIDTPKCNLREKKKVPEIWVNRRLKIGLT